jgi:hypothetical protein
MTDEEQVETGEVTERFRAFSQTVDPEPSKALPMTLIGLAVAAAAAVVVILVLVFG